MDRSLESVPDDPSHDRGPIRDLLTSLANLLATTIAIAQTRVELLTTEIQEEMHRVAVIMVWTFVALLAAGIGFGLGALAIIFFFWDTHRLAASLAMTGGFFALAIVAGYVLRAKLRAKPRLLAGTLAELAEDRERLANRR